VNHDQGAVDGRVAHIQREAAIDHRAGGSAAPFHPFGAGGRGAGAGRSRRRDVGGASGRSEREEGENKQDAHMGRHFRCVKAPARRTLGDRRRRIHMGWRRQYSIWILVLALIDVKTLWPRAWQASSCGAAQFYLVFPRVRPATLRLRRIERRSAEAFAKADAGEDDHRAPSLIAISSKP
jgi:hypothetical protein